MSWAQVVRMARAFPEVEPGTAYGTPALRVRKRFMLRLREDQKSLAVRCGFDERDFRLRADPRTFYVTDHYRGYPAVLVRLDRVSPRVMREVLEQAWRVNAPKTLVRGWDETARL